MQQSADALEVRRRRRRHVRPGDGCDGARRRGRGRRDLHRPRDRRRCRPHRSDARGLVRARERGLPLGGHRAGRHLLAAGPGDRVRVGARRERRVRRPAHVRAGVRRRRRAERLRVAAARPAPRRGAGRDGRHRPRPARLDRRDRGRVHARTRVGRPQARRRQGVPVRRAARRPGRRHVPVPRPRARPLPRDPAAEPRWSHGDDVRRRDGSAGAGGHAVDGRVEGWHRHRAPARVRQARRRRARHHQR